MAVQIRLVNPGGGERQVEVFGRCGRWAFLWWPNAGIYDLDLRSGELRRDERVIREWRAPGDETERLRGLPQEVFGSGAG